MKAPENMTREELEDEVAFLRSEMGLSSSGTAVQLLRSGFGMDSGSARAVAALYSARGRVLTYFQIAEAMASEAEGIKRLVSVFVCRARGKLGRDAVETAWGVGYRLSPVGIAKIDAVLNPQRSAA